MVEEAEMIPVLATGLSGMVGSRVSELLSNDFLFTDISRRTGVDITDETAVEECIRHHDAPVILHMAAKTDVDGCEDDKLSQEEGEAWMVNVIGTQNIASAAKKTGKRMVYISTDFVFDGSQEKYTEDDEPNPVNWYGRTKYEGEQRIKETDIGAVIVRIAYPYGTQSAKKKDFVARIQEYIRNNTQVKAVTDHVFMPTHVDDIAPALGIFLSRPLAGTYHVVGSRPVTSVEVIQEVADRMKKTVLIVPVTREEYFVGRAFRPRNLVLNNDRITELGIHMRGFGEETL